MLSVGFVCVHFSVVCFNKSRLHLYLLSHWGLNFVIFDFLIVQYFWTNANRIVTQSTTKWINWMNLNENFRFSINSSSVVLFIEFWSVLLECLSVLLKKRKGYLQLALGNIYWKSNMEIAKFRNETHCLATNNKRDRKKNFCELYVS